MTEKPRPYSLLYKQSPWIHNSNNIWLASTITLNRNIEKFKFPGKLPADRRKQILSLLGQDLLGLSLLKSPKLIKAEDMQPIEKEFLSEHFLSDRSLQQTHIGEAFVIDESGEFLAILNLGDHLTLQWIDFREELEATWDRLVKIEKELSTTINFAFSPRFGFLTSDPTQCGTALTARIFLHTPGLIYLDRFDEIIKKYKEETIGQTSLQGNPADLVGDIVVFYNLYTLGLTEENILTSLRTLATKILVEEKSARLFLKQEKNLEIKDRISRAYGILLHSYQIEAIEALHAISLLKLGVDLEWITGITHAALNELLLESLRAHLLCHYEEQVNQEDIPRKRAEFIHKSLKNVQLAI